MDLQDKENLPLGGYTIPNLVFVSQDILSLSTRLPFAPENLNCKIWLERFTTFVPTSEGFDIGIYGPR